MKQSANTLTKAQHRKQTASVDKTRVSIHEAGHAVAAISVGASDVKAVISKRKKAAPNEMLWGGYAHFGHSPMTKLNRAVVGISGEMANWFSDLGSERCFWSEMCEDFVALVEWGVYAPSATDYIYLGEIWNKNGPKIASMSGKILSRHWDAIESTALWLSSKEYLFDGQIRMLIEEPSANLEEVSVEDLPLSPRAKAFEKLLLLRA